MRPKWWLAGLFSLWCPGLGHYYCGAIVRAVVLFVIFIVVSHAAVAAIAFWNQAPFNILLPVVIFLLLWVAIIWNAVLTARRTKKSDHSVWYRQWYSCLLLGIIAASIVTRVSPYVDKYEGFKVPSGSMANAIMSGDYVLADLEAYRAKSPRSDDVIIYRWPGDMSTMRVDRCVAGPSDTVELVGRALYVNGVKEVEPPTVRHELPTVGDSEESFGPYIVPDSSYFVLGDNRDNSYDSRYWGAVPHRMLMGKVIRVYLSSDLSRIGLPVR
jgi:signal peptidase I